jgi:hypothetical protein
MDGPAGPQRAPAAPVPKDPNRAGRSRQVTDWVGPSLGRRPWTGSWTGSPDTPSATSAIDAMACAIVAVSGPAAQEHASRNAPLASFRLAVAPAFWPHTDASRRCQSSLGYEQADRRPSPSRPVTHAHSDLGRRHRAVSTCLTMPSPFPGVLVTTTVTRLGQCRPVAAAHGGRPGAMDGDASCDASPERACSPPAR